MWPKWQNLNYTWMFSTPPQRGTGAESKRFDMGRLNLIAFPTLRKQTSTPGGLVGYLRHAPEWGMAFALPKTRAPIALPVDCEYWDYGLSVPLPEKPDQDGIYRLIPFTRYRMECWIKVEGRDTEAFVSNYSAGLTQTNRIVHPYYHTRSEEAPISQYINPIGRYRTPSVREGDWKHVSIEFKTEPTGQALMLGFVCLGRGKAYFDDFRLTEIGDEE